MDVVIHCHLSDCIDGGDKVDICDCKFKGNISGKCNVNLFELNARIFNTRSP